jgi:hypothetical protein
VPPPIFPATHFTSLTEAEVMAALDDPDPGNPIAVEVARLIEGYTENFRAHVESLGYIPDSFLRVKPQTAIEAVAMRLTTEAIQDELASYIYAPPHCQQ